jgi:putative CocE/NonD family hydrolase
VDATGETTAGDRSFGPTARIDYDEVVLRWMDRYLKGIVNGVDREKPVRYFVMGANTWRDADTWPPVGSKTVPLYLRADARAGGLSWTKPEARESSRTFVSDPANPLTDPYEDFGGHDYRALAERSNVLVYDTPPLDADLEVTGHITAEIYLSCDAPDTDLWVRLLDVAPDGTAFNLMSPGLDVLRASYRDPARGRQLLQPGKVYKLRLTTLVTSNVFLKGHRIRVQVSAEFFPHFSRNLHTGELETVSAKMGKATLRIHHDRARPSRILLPVVGPAPR